MSQQFDAIYDNVVLKPLVPLSLPEKARVKRTVESQALSDTDKLAKPKATLLKRWHELDQLPETQNNDGWSVRQHDGLLYRGKR